MRSTVLAFAVAIAALPALGSSTQGQIPPDCQGLSRRPVLFVHGSGLGPDTWNAMISAFRRDGYPARHLLAVRLIPNDGSNIRAAERFIEPTVRDLLSAARREAEAKRCQPPTKVDIVAHSMGALSSRWYVARIDAKLIRNLVGIAPANHGTDALCGHAGDGNRELCPAFAQGPAQGAVQHMLNGSRSEPIDETPYGFGSDSTGRPSIGPTPESGIYYWSIRIDPDEWIRPASSAHLDGAGGRRAPQLPLGALETSPGNVRWRSGIPHDDLPRDAEVIAFTLQLLLADPKR